MDLESMGCVLMNTQELENTQGGHKGFFYYMGAFVAVSLHGAMDFYRGVWAEL